MPQLRFNEDGEWHDFAPEGGTGLKAGPWFPCLYLKGDDRLTDLRVDRPRATKSAGMKHKPSSSSVKLLFILAGQSNVSSFFRSCACRFT